MSDRLSKTMAYALRHHPEKFGLTLDEQGWVHLTDFAGALSSQGGKTISEADVLEVVASDSKGRYVISGKLIRAAQGHSLKVDLGYAQAVPPEFLFHGTVEKFLPSISKTGLVKGGRHAVHLSASKETAEAVGRRRGEAVILTISAEAMSASGYVFTVSQNKVWLVDFVPMEYITFP